MDSSNNDEFVYLFEDDEEGLDLFEDDEEDLKENRAEFDEGGDLALEDSFNTSEEEDGEYHHESEGYLNDEEEVFESDTEWFEGVETSDSESIEGLETSFSEEEIFYSENEEGLSTPLDYSFEEGDEVYSENPYEGLEDVVEALEGIEELDEPEIKETGYDFSNLRLFRTDNLDKVEYEDGDEQEKEYSLDNYGSDAENDANEEDEGVIDWSSDYGNLEWEETVETGEIEYEEELGYVGTRESLETEDLETLKHNLFSSNFQVEKSAYNLTHDSILIGDIVISEPVTKAREKTYAGLSASVGEMSVLTPIDVLIMEGYQQWLDTPEDERSIVYTGHKYQLLSGMRRVFAAKKNGLDSIPAQIWRFKNPAYGRNVAILLSCILDKKQRHSWGEIWNTMGVLEDQFAEITPTQLEYLLDIEPGDSMKLKDVMGSQFEYPEIVQDLLEGNKTLQQSYQALQKARKEVSQWDREDSLGVSGLEEAGDLVDALGSGGLSNADVMDILNMANEDFDLSEEDFGGNEEESLSAVEQDVDDRHPLDPVLRGNVLVRDGYSCQCCRFGEDLNNSLVLPSLTVHHMIPVYINKMKHATVRCQDIMENLVTVCDACHKAIHSCSDSRAKLPVSSEEEFLEMETFQQERWKNILKYARIITKAETVTGFKRKKHDSKTLPVSKPFWEAGVENEEAIAMAQNSNR